MNHALDPEAQPLDVQVALANLQRASVVGLTDHMAESICLLRKLTSHLPWTGESAATGNVSHVRYSDHVLNSPQLTEMAFALTRHDYVVYAAGVKIFASTLAHYPECDGPPPGLCSSLPACVAMRRGLHNATDPRVASGSGWNITAEQGSQRSPGKASAIPSEVPLRFVFSFLALLTVVTAVLLGSVHGGLMCWRCICGFGPPPGFIGRSSADGDEEMDSFRPNVDRRDCSLSVIGRSIADSDEEERLPPNVDRRDCS